MQIELLVVTNLPYKHLVAIIYPYSSKTKGKVGIHATPRIGSCCYSYKIVYTVTRWFVWNIIFVCTQTVPAFSNKNCSSQAVTYLLPLKQGHHFYPLLRLLPVTTETRTSFLPSTVTYLLLQKQEHHFYPLLRLLPTCYHRNKNIISTLYSGLLPTCYHRNKIKAGKILVITKDTRVSRISRAEPDRTLMAESVYTTFNRTIIRC